MNLDILQKIMIEKGLSIRAIPMANRIVVELRHKDDFPNGHVQYLEEFKREMWVEERQNPHRGQFVVESNCGTRATVKFSGKRFYNSLQDLFKDYESEYKECEDCGHTECVICNPNYDADESRPGPKSTYDSVITTGTIFTAQDHFRTLRYKMIGVDLSRDGYIRLQNLDDGTETIVEPEWFRQRKIVIEQAI